MMERIERRLMGLDVGRRRIGIALSDLLRLTAQPHSTLVRGRLPQDVAQIARLARQYDVGGIVVGRPRHMDGRASQTLQEITPLFDALTTELRLPVRWYDERLSTQEAQERMAALGIPPHQRRKRKDEFAAAVILGWYLEEQS